MLKKLSFILVLLSGLLISLPALAEDTGTTTVNCFDYYHFGSVQVTVESELSNAVSGTKMNFIGTIKNSNSYPVVNGKVVVKIFKKQDAKDMQGNGPLQVDQFIAKDNVNIDASSTQQFNFSWAIPSYAKSGDYQVATFFTSGNEFNLLGLTFTDDIVGNTFDFKVSGEQTKIVEFDKNSVKVNGTPYFFAAFPPHVDIKTDGVLTANLLNETNENQSVNVTWKTYWWDAQRQENLLDTKTETINLTKGETKNLSYTVKDNNHSVYLVVAEVDYKDTKSIMGARFVRDGINLSRINFPAVTSFPLQAGTSTTLFSCLHNTSNADVQNGQLSLKLEDPSGNVIHSYTYNGTITGAMMGVKDDFVPSRSYDKFSLVAELKQDGKVVDSAKMDYDCKLIDASKCLPETKINILVLTFLIILLIIAGIALFIFEKKRHKTLVAVGALIIMALGITYLLSAYKAFGSAPTYDGSGGGSLVVNIPAPQGQWISYDTGPEDYTMEYTIVDDGYTVVMANVNPSITYKVKSSKPTNSPVSSGDVIRFTFNTPSNQDISWFFTGASSDSPYGYWVPNAGMMSASTAIQAQNDVGPGGGVDRYVTFDVAPPVKTLTNTTGLSCAAAVTDSTGTYQDCTVSTVAATTTINPKFSFAATYGLFWVAWAGGYQATQPLQGTYNVPSPWEQAPIPAQTIPYTFTVIPPPANHPPTAPTISGPTTGTVSTSMTFGAVSTDPDNAA